MPTQDPRAGADKMENTNKMTERRDVTRNPKYSKIGNGSAAKMGTGIQ